MRGRGVKNIPKCAYVICESHLLDFLSMAASLFYVDSLGEGGVRKMPIVLNEILMYKRGRGLKKSNILSQAYMKRKILSVVKVVVPWHFLPHAISFFVILDNCSTCKQIFQKSRYQGGALNKIYSNHVRNKIEFADSIKFSDSSFIIQDFKTENYSKVRNI